MNRYKFFKHKPEYIYRFVPLNIYSIDTLISYGLYFGSPENQNDPWDCNFNVESTTPGSEDARKQYGVPNENLNTELENHLKELKSKYGICCFTKDYRNILLWSHYASGGKGLCLVFKRQQLLDSLNSSDNNIVKIKDVKYEEVTFSINQKRIDREELEKPLYHKLKEWDYEKEVRLYSKFDDNNKRFLKFDPKSLKAIITGDKFGLGTNHRILAGILKPIHNEIIIAQLIRDARVLNARIYSIDYDRY